jgi:hypothetical protein
MKVAPVGEHTDAPARVFSASLRPNFCVNGEAAGRGYFQSSACSLPSARIRGFPLAEAGFAPNSSAGHVRRVRFMTGDHHNGLSL